MIVDDDEDDIALFCEAVAQIDKNLVCATAGNGIEALKNLETDGRLPKCIFLDVNMPLMDGRQTLKILRNDPKYADIPVIMYSTTQNEREIMHYIDQGVAFVVKPTSFGKIIDVIRQHLHNISMM
jgi:CheY-like chemotaxis protein